MSFLGPREFYSANDSDVEALLENIEILRRIDVPPEKQVVSFFDKLDHIGALVTPVRQNVPEVLKAAGYEVSSFLSEVIADEIGAPTRCFRGSKMLSERQLTVELFQPLTEAGRLRARSQGAHGGGTGEGIHFAFRLDRTSERDDAISELESIGYFLRRAGVNRREQQTIRFFDGPYGRVEIVSAGADL